MTRSVRTALTGLLSAWATLVTVSGQIVPYGGAAEYVRDLADRRARTMSVAGRDAVLVLWSAPERVHSNDVHYEYRQDSNLLYLTGIDQPDTILVLVPGADADKEHLFVRRAEPLRELWSGHTLTPSEVTAESGIANVHPQRDTEAFDAFMTALLSGSAPGAPRIVRLGVLGRIGPAMSAPHTTPDADQPGAWARAMSAKHPAVKPFNASDILSTLRQIKTDYEQTVLRRSVEISAEAHIEGMRAARPGRWEYEVEAAIEGTFLRSGALSWGYPSIVGSGPNATILHYLASTRQMGEGDLLLVDAAGSFQGLTGDITRTYPVNGQFSSAQRAVYDVVLRAQEAGIRAARPGARVEEIVRAVRRVLGDGLEDLGFVSEPSGAERDAQISVWFPHGPVHGIGLDVHDPLGTVLEPGAAFVIEPGVYVRPDALERLPDSPSRADEARRLAPIIERYRDIGVRVEDSFLMTASGPVNLSVKAPKTIDALERIVGRAR